MWCRFDCYHQPSQQHRTIMSQPTNQCSHHFSRHKLVTSTINRSSRSSSSLIFGTHLVCNGNDDARHPTSINHYNSHHLIFPYCLKNSPSPYSFILLQVALLHLCVVSSSSLWYHSTVSHPIRPVPVPSSLLLCWSPFSIIVNCLLPRNQRTKLLLLIIPICWCVHCRVISSNYCRLNISIIIIAPIYQSINQSTPLPSLICIVTS